MIIDRTYKKGIDKHIGKLQKYLHDKLITAWALVDDNANKYKAYPRCHRNQTADGYVPEFKKTGATDANDYTQVLWEDSLFALSFFGIGNVEMDVVATQQVHVIFFVNLSDIKPGNERRDEEVRLDVMKILNTGMYNFALKEVITGIKDVFAEYDGYLVNEGLKYRDMHPNHCFRFNMELVYNPTQCY